MGSPHVLENICIPKFDNKDKLHLKFTDLSELAHKETAKGNDVSEIEMEIDELAANIWGLTKEELKEIQAALEGIS